ncbi:hypothetical protein AB1Y20_009415 [Prymnesium parvum]|uniref:Uncharacterized protein n=1 Tax=Prymnesium parvum TaxID=97485 RepID=A0AB34K0N2_PRYPA
MLTPTPRALLLTTLACGLALAILYRRATSRSAATPADDAAPPAAATAPKRSAEATPAARGRADGAPPASQKRSKARPKPSEPAAPSDAARAEEVRLAVQAEARRRARAAASAPPAQPSPSSRGEAEPTEGEAFVNTIVNRSVLTQPIDLSKEAQPASPKKGKDAASKKARKPKPLSSWAEAFIEAMQILEGSEPEATTQAQHKLNGVLASAAKPGAPRDAVPITFRALGYIAASTSHLDRAEAAYSKALSEAQRRCPDSIVLCGCLRDLAVLARERGRHADAMGMWDQAVAALEAFLKADKSFTALEAESMRLELQLCRADCMRDQGRFDESEALTRRVLEWREKQLGYDAAGTLAAVYDISKCLRAKSLGGEPLPSEREAAAACLGTRLDALSGAAAELDARWIGGLRRLCEDDPPFKWAEHVVMLGSVAQLHKSHAEAIYLFRLATPAYKERLAESEGSAGDATGDSASASDISLEVAELMNSLGESLLELRQHAPAARAFEEAHVQVVKAQGENDPSVASVEANQAKLYADQGESQKALALFQRAHAVTLAASEDSLATAADGSKLVMNQALHARVLKLYGDFLGTQGRDAEAAEMKRKMEQLEVKYGFTTQ